MNFNTLLRDELLRFFNFEICCMKAELYAILKNNATLSMEKGKTQLIIECRDSSVLKKTAALVKDLFDASLKIEVLEKNCFAGQKRYRGTIEEKEAVIDILNTFQYKALIDYSSLNSEILQNDCCKASFVRGTFLSCGYIGNPGKRYLMEFTFSDKNYGLNFSNLLTELEIKNQVYSRKENIHIVYLKTGDAISRLLPLTGAVRTLLEFENFRVVRATRGEVNRLTNFDTANIERVSLGSCKHINAVEYLMEKGMLDNLNENLIEIARIRVENPYLSLREIGEKTFPPLTKSVVAYRIRKIIKYYESFVKKKK